MVYFFGYIISFYKVYTCSGKIGQILCTLDDFRLFRCKFWTKLWITTWTSCCKAWTKNIMEFNLVEACKPWTARWTIIDVTYGRLKMEVFCIWIYGRSKHGRISRKMSSKFLGNMSRLSVKSTRFFKKLGQRTHGTYRTRTLMAERLDETRKMAIFSKYCKQNQELGPYGP